MHVCGVMCDLGVTLFAQPRDGPGASYKADKFCESSVLLWCSLTYYLLPLHSSLAYKARVVFNFLLKSVFLLVFKHLVSC